MNLATHLLLGALVSAALTSNAGAEPAARMQVAEIKPLLLAALKHGSSHGVLVGETASYVRRTFDSAAPIEIDIRALHALPQPGCSRLEVRTRQRGVLEQGKRGDRELVYQVSFCSDGLLPEKR